MKDMVEIRKIEEVWGGVDIPEITGVYDPLSGLRDGTITSQAPIVVSGYNLNRTLRGRWLWLYRS